MNNDNVKKGYKKLFTAELLMIISGFSGMFTEENLVYLGLGLAALGLVAFFINLGGLKLLRTEEKGFNRAYVLTILSIVVYIAYGIAAAITENSMMSNLANEIDNIFEFCITYSVLTASVILAANMGKSKLARDAKKTAIFFTIAFAISEILGVIGAFENTAVILAGILMGIAAVVLMLIAEIKYFFFLLHMKNELQE